MPVLNYICYCLVVERSSPMVSNSVAFWEVPCSNFSLRQAMLTDVFHGFLHSLQVNAGSTSN